MADSDGRGASFYPEEGFRPGETVTVTTDFPICGTSEDSSTFQVALPPLGKSGAAPPSTPQPVTPASAVQHFQSAPALRPPVLTVSKPDPSSEGDFFLNPKGGTRAGGPMIVNGKGQLVWFDPLPLGVNSADLRVQSFNGQSVLTWWQGQITAGIGYGEDVIMNDHYQVLDVVKAANGYSADLHEFLLGPNATAWITADSEVRWNLSAVGGPSDGAAEDGIVQEIDLRTGNVLFQWDSLDHVPPELSAVSYAGPGRGPYDYFHVNSIDPSGYGTVLISSRNTDAVYLVDISSGAVVWRLGGKASSFSMGPGTRFALQHDARLRGGSVVTLFDDEDVANGGPPARAIEIKLDLAEHTARLVWAHEGPHDSVVGSQGNVQLLPDSHVVVGWGAGPGSPTTEMTSAGQILFQASLPKAIDSYRAFRLNWDAQPTTRPVLAAQTIGAGVEVEASWNGATAVKSWRVLGGASATTLRVIQAKASSGFQTTVQIRSRPAYLAVEAMASDGQVLSTSAPIATT